MVPLRFVLSAERARLLKQMYVQPAEAPFRQGAPFAPDVEIELTDRRGDPRRPATVGERQPVLTVDPPDRSYLEC